MQGQQHHLETCFDVWPKRPFYEFNTYTAARMLQLRTTIVKKKTPRKCKLDYVRGHGIVSRHALMLDHNRDFVVNIGSSSLTKFQLKITIVMRKGL